MCGAFLGSTATGWYTPQVGSCWERVGRKQEILNEEFVCDCKGVLILGENLMK